MLQLPVLWAFLCIEMQIEAVIFDMDGLMLDTETLSRSAWLQAAEELKVDVTPDLYLQMVGRNYRDCRSVLLRELGDTFPLEPYLTRANAIYRSLLDKPPACKRGLFELLDFLDHHQLPKGVATSSTLKIAEHKLGSCGILHRFQAMATGDVVERGKPAPDIFLLCAERLGVNPAGCIVLEDSPMGIIGAAAAGMHPIMVPDLIEPSTEIRAQAGHIVASLEDVPPILEKWLAYPGEIPL